MSRRFDYEQPRESRQFRTRPIPVDGARGRHSRRAPSRSGSAIRGLSGALAVGSLVLALALVGVQFWATGQGQQGPGLPAVISQLVTSVAAVAVQAVADRRRDLVGGLATLGVFVLVLGSLWFWWWA
ncbi:hypothetical protein SAMN05421805_105235 [Saccharopolyspora antimicrobica]|uniref:Uncharacterized protein n=1 Tax=Saccharopolyspora antimicrobica TaxID=455193 RepID=A0A1I5A453_9PSEU|nr:hypothetical protein [Saccharopolyspora antimicrobica]RKT83280.1 hypothetical protein ATL45_1561 [Saccharopolyspora antimicrobica]SFN57305.1 hypothetical protein SAMN05421805_105235 [Saccharopolyspora antimicrobica]